jgi:hypothetical protein
MPRFVLQRIEETFLAVREGMVSVFCICAQKIILLSSVVSFHSIRNQTFNGKVVLIFIIQLGSSFIHACSDNRLVCYVGE